MIATGAAAVDAVVELAATAPVTPKNKFHRENRRHNDKQEREK